MFTEIADDIAEFIIKTEQPIRFQFPKAETDRSTRRGKVERGLSSVSYNFVELFTPTRLTMIQSMFLLSNTGYAFFFF